VPDGLEPTPEGVPIHEELGTPAIFIHLGNPVVGQDQKGTANATAGQREQTDGSS
jgi:hypothetical protein